MAKKIKYAKDDYVRALDNSYGQPERASFRKGIVYEVAKNFYETKDEYDSVEIVEDSNGIRNSWGQKWFEPAYPTPVSLETFAHSFTPGGVPEEAFQGVEPKKVLGTQVGGSHYTNCAIQPISYIWANNIGFSEGNVIKYVTRWKSKGGIKDLKKAHHHIALLIEHAEAEEARIGIQLYGLQA